jgi:hypothetical protein
MAQKKPQKLFVYPEDQRLEKDYTQIYDWLSRLELTTDNPKGSRIGKYTGDILYVQTGGKHYAAVCIDGGSTSWYAVELTNIL